MPFGMVSAVGRGMIVLDGVGYRRTEGAVLGLKLGRPIVTNGDFATRLFPNLGSTCFPDNNAKHINGSATHQTEPCQLKFLS